MAVEEHVFHKEEGITVSSSRLVLHNKTIVMNSVCSIELDQEVIRPPYLILGISVFSFLVGMFSVHPLASQWGIFIGIATGIIGVFRWLSGENNKKDAIVIELQSGEKEYIDIKEVDDLQAVFKALNEAIIFRG